MKLRFDARGDRVTGEIMDRIGVFFGGKSAEYDISLMSARAVLSAMDKTLHTPVMIGITSSGEWKIFEGDIDKIEEDQWEDEASPLDPRELPKIIDFAFPMIHGDFGEDGKLQAILETLEIPYAGSGVLSSAICMDKIATKEIFIANEIPVCGYIALTGKEIRDDIQAAAEKCGKLGFPLFVKPANTGSSVGVSKVESAGEIEAALLLALKYDRRVLAEVGVDCREIETAVIGNEDARSGAIGEITYDRDFYDYEAKYGNDTNTRLHIPADLPDELMDKVREIAVKAYKVMDCAGFARVDFMIDRASKEVYVNEINTIPGFTRYSMFPMLWQEAGVSFSELIEEIVRFGYERYTVENCGTAGR